MVYIDTLYDYIQCIGCGDGSQNAGSIASLPKARWNTPVAIIGAGAAGLVAAYELLKIGASPVVFEAHPHRLGGRLYSQQFTDAQGKPDPTTFAEMGAMRFPRSSRLLFHYVNDVFGLRTARTFPNPGQVPTKLYYGNSVIDWPAGQPYPPGFERALCPVQAGNRPGQPGVCRAPGAGKWGNPEYRLAGYRLLSWGVQVAVSGSGTKRA